MIIIYNSEQVQNQTKQLISVTTKYVLFQEYHKGKWIKDFMKQSSTLNLSYYNIYDSHFKS